MQTNGLDRVLLLSKKLQKESDTILRTETKRVGSYLMPLTEEEKAGEIEKVRERYNREINSIYVRLNEKRKKDGLEPIMNPYI